MHPQISKEGTIACKSSIYWFIQAWRPIISSHSDCPEAFFIIAFSIQHYLILPMRNCDTSTVWSQTLFISAVLRLCVSYTLFPLRPCLQFRYEWNIATLDYVKHKRDFWCEVVQQETLSVLASINKGSSHSLNGQYKQCSFEINTQMTARIQRNTSTHKWLITMIIVNTNFK